MNIFYLDDAPEKAVQMLCDCHVVKMTLETAQLFSTYFHRIGNNNPILYKSTRIHPPCQKCLDNFENVVWLAYYFQAILKEYTFRYGKVHKCQQIFDKCVKPLLRYSINFDKLTFPKCMPEEYKADSLKNSYFNY